MRESTRASLIEAWNIAQRELQIRVTAPFHFAVAETTLDCIAFLPDFGGPAGMVVDAIRSPKFLPAKGVVKAADQAGYYISLINTDIYSCFDAETFKEALLEWGYLGPSSMRPDWFPRLRP